MNSDTDKNRLEDLVPAPVLAVLGRIADALEGMRPAGSKGFSLDGSDAFIWHADGEWAQPVEKVNRVTIDLLKGIDLQRQTLHDNTERFARGLPANNTLLWGARGSGKSSLVKAVHAEIAERDPGSLKLIEIHREDIPSLPVLLGHMRQSATRCLLFCDDLSFDGNDTSYKSLKAVLEGGIEGRPENVLFYATSNRRHLMPRDMIENEQSTAINPSEAVDEKVSLSDRFGLWLGFHTCDQKTYLDMIRGYLDWHGINVAEKTWAPMAIEWSATRGARSGRVAWQFVQDLAGRKGKALD